MVVPSFGRIVPLGIAGGSALAFSRPKEISTFIRGECP